MNILLINHYAGSPTHGMEYRPYYMAREWVRAGHRVTIVAATQSHVRTYQPVAGDSPFVEEWIDGIRYLWLRTPRYSGNGLGRIVNMLTFVMRLGQFGRRIGAVAAPDAVIASSTYPFDIVPARRIAQRHAARLVFEVHDLWPLTPIEISSMSRWHPFIMAVQWAEDFAYRHADRVVSMLPRAQDYMVSRGMNGEKFAYVPNGIAVDDWSAPPVPIPDAHAKVLQQCRERGKFVLGYAGTHGVANGLDLLLDAAALLRDKPVTLVLVGQGPEKSRLERRATEMGLDNVVFLAPVAKRAIPSLLQRFDAAYIGWRRQPLYRFGISPNKLMDYMMGERVVVHSIEAGNDPVAESGCGISVTPENAQMIAQATLELMALSAETRRAMGKRGRDFVLAHHDYRVLAEKFLSVIGENARG